MTGRRRSAPRPLICSLLGALLLLAPAAGADTPLMPVTGNPLLDRLPEATLRAIAQAPEQALDHVLYKMRTIDPDADSISFDDMHRSEQQRHAAERAKRMKHLLSRDLDGDGAVTRAEYDDVQDASGTVDPGAFDSFAQKTDTDGNGLISAAELYAYADRRAAQGNPLLPPQTDPYDPALFDADGDRVVSVGEATGMVAAVSAVLARLSPFSAAGPGPTRCAAPVPSPEAEVVFLSGYQGGGLSSVAVDGMNRPTGVATIVVEEGGTKSGEDDGPPLYILATTALPVIWKIEGAAHRVAQFVAQPPPAALGPGTGVIGLPAEVVTFTAPGSCLERFDDRKNPGARPELRQLARRLGRKPEAVTYVGHHELQGVHVPSGKATDTRPANSFLGITFVSPPGEAEAADGAGRVTQAPAAEADGDGGGVLPNSRPVPAAPAAAEPAATDPAPSPVIEKLMQELRRFHPGGLIRIDPGQVVAPGPVPAYDVLPSLAGVIQLLESGALRKTSEDTYVVLAPLPRFPADWDHHDAPTTKVVLGEGVPEPQAGPGRIRLARN